MRNGKDEPKTQLPQNHHYDCIKDPECILSFLPWERGLKGKRTTQIVKKVLTIHSYKSDTTSTHRRLLDAYSSSLLHVSRIYNKAFGYKARKVPAHMPHMVDSDIIYEMQDKFWPYFEATSSHRLRHPQDMQFAFSFNYYVIGVKQAANISQLFDEIDTDKSGDVISCFYFLSNQENIFSGSSYLIGRYNVRQKFRPFYFHYHWTS